MYKDIDEAIKHAIEVAEEQREIWEKYSDRYGRGGYAKCIKCAEEHEQLVTWLEELKELRELKDTYAKGMETSYSEFRYKQGRADAINPIQKFIDDYDGAIIISENMGVINGQQLINELKEIVEQLKENKEWA